jgi:hypothetical protein
MSIVDFCVVGFPKCGTTATVAMLKESPALKVHYNGDEPEAPFFVPARNLRKPEPVPGRANGHKFTAYIYSNNRMRDILAEKPDALLLINVRPAGEALLSWRDMHREIARRGEGGHFVARPDQREFYANCSEADYFEAYAKERLAYAQTMRKVLRIAPKANYLVITQARLSRDARGVMKEIHDRLGVEAPDSYYEGLPSGHKARGSRDISERVDRAAVVSQIKAYDADLMKLIGELDPARVLRSDPDGF